MRRALGLLAGSYLLLALVGLAAEKAGVNRCECAADCWCRQPGPSTFRWVFPWGHRSPVDAA
jgi:hypothetical protein